MTWHRLNSKQYYELKINIAANRSAALVTNVGITWLAFAACIFIFDICGQQRYLYISLPLAAVGIIIMSVGIIKKSRWRDKTEQYDGSCAEYRTAKLLGKVQQANGSGDYRVIVEFDSGRKIKVGCSSAVFKDNLIGSKVCLIDLFGDKSADPNACFVLSVKEIFDIINVSQGVLPYTPPYSDTDEWRNTTASRSEAESEVFHNLREWEKETITTILRRRMRNAAFILSLFLLPVAANIITGILVDKQAVTQEPFRSILSVLSMTDMLIAVLIFSGGLLSLLLVTDSYRSIKDLTRKHTLCADLIVIEKAQRYYSYGKYGKWEFSYICNDRITKHSIRITVVQNVKVTKGDRLYVITGRGYSSYHLYKIP